MTVVIGFLNLGGGEIVLILLLALIMFGAKKIPELAKGLGQGIKEFKKATREVTDEIQNSMDDTHYTSARTVEAPKKAQEIGPGETAATPAPTTQPATEHKA